VFPGGELLSGKTPAGIPNVIPRSSYSSLKKGLQPTYFLASRLKDYMEAVNDPALGVVDQLRAAFGAQTPAQIREANAWLESFQGRAEAWQVADQLLAMPLAAGADAVMCGSLLSGTDESPGKIIEESDGTRWKTYRGMASKEAQINWRGKYSSFEGVSARVPYRGSVKNILSDLEKGIRSGFSYSGARTLSELQSAATFVKQTSAGIGESKTHITGRQW